MNYQKYRRKQIMAKARGGGQGGQGGQGIATGCCGVEAVVTVDARGQIVLPKELRDLAGIGTGDKLAVVSMRSSGRICCLSLMKVEELAGTVRDILGPVARELSGGGKNDE
jgi:antitoxin PrlF